jgi:Mrp family chromosome partitioning ATPase
LAKLRAIFIRRWPILLVTLLLGAIAGYLSTSVGVERGVTIFDAEQVIVANRLAGNPANVSQDALKVSRGPVPERAAELLGEDGDAASLAREVVAKAEVESNSIKLAVNDVDPERASEVVQAFTAAFLEIVNAELRSDNQRQLEKLEERVAEAEAAIETFDQEYGFISNPATPLTPSESVDTLVAERNRLLATLTDAQRNLDDAELRTTQREPYTTLGPEKPKPAEAQLIEVPESPFFRAGLLGMIGLMLGIGLVLIIERVNQRIDTRDELAALLPVPIIAEIGRIPARRRPGKGEGQVELDGVWSEHYRRVRSAIQFVQADAEEKLRADGVQPGVARAPSGAVIAGHRGKTGAVPRVFLFASALPGEGKSTSVALTALALAETGTDTLVINADFRRPMVEKYLGAAAAPSLADRAEMSVDRPSLDDVVQSTQFDHLWLAASGKPTHEVGGRLDAARELAAEAAARGGTVLLDSSPLRVSNDPIDLLASVDEVILVVRAGRTTVKSIEDTMELLEMHHAPTLGVILIGTLSTREMYAYYQSYYQQAERADAEHRGDVPPGGQAPDSSSAPDPSSSQGQEREQPVYAKVVSTPPPYPPPPFGPPEAPAR